MKYACRLLAAAALFAAPSLRAEPMDAPKPASELSQLSYLVGAWNCSGTTFASPMGPEHASQGVARAQMELGGFRLVIHYDETKAAANPMPYHILQIVGWDSEKKAFDSVCFDVFGGSCAQTSPGWKDNGLVFEGTAVMGGQKMSARDSFTKKDANEMTHKGEMQGPDGKWTTGDEETCKRAGKTAKK